MGSPARPELDRRSHTIENKLVIYEFIASHPLCVDTGVAESVAPDPSTRTNTLGTYMYANTHQVLTDEQIDVILNIVSNRHPSVLVLHRLARAIESAVLSSLGAMSEPLTEQCDALMGNLQSGRKLESMLSDYEALEGVEAWLNQQELRINMALRGSGPGTETVGESAAGWLLRLVQHAKGCAGRSWGETNNT